LNPQKLAGQCGKLKCCLNYELDTYLEALKDFPSNDTKLMTEKGIAFCQKSDIFKATFWFSYKDEPANWHILSKEQVQEILAKNKKKEKVASLEEYAIENHVIEEKVLFENVVGQDSLTRFDRPKRSKSRNKNKNRKRNKGNNSQNKNAQNKRGDGRNTQSSNKNNRRRKKNSNRNRGQNKQKSQAKNA